LPVLRLLVTLLIIVLPVLRLLVTLLVSSKFPWSNYTISVNQH